MLSKYSNHIINIIFLIVTVSLLIYLVYPVINKVVSGVTRHQLPIHQLQKNQNHHFPDIRKINENLEKLNDKKEELIKKHTQERAIVEVLPPEVMKLKKLLQEYKSDPENQWDKVIAIGDIYRKGAYPRFLPDEDMAIECYKICSACPDGEIAGIAQSKYIETRTETITSVDRAGKPLPRLYAIEVCEVAEKTIMMTPSHKFNKPIYNKQSAAQSHKPTRHEPTNIFEDIIGGFAAFEVTDTEMDILEQQRDRRNINIDINNISHDVPAYHSDSQNVHDHSVVRTMKHNIRALKEEDDTNTNSEDIKNQVRYTILEQDLSEEEKYNALQVLDNLSTNKHSVFDTSESDVLKLVWDKISASKDTETQKNLKEMLTKQLASGLENGYVVCSTGKIGRLMGTFDGVLKDDKLEDSRPMWAVKEEIANMAANIRKRTLDGMSESQRNLYETGGDKEVEQRMIKEFETSVKEEYVKKLGMSSNVIEPIVQTYAEGF